MRYPCNEDLLEWARKWGNSSDVGISRGTYEGISDSTNTLTEYANKESKWGLMVISADFLKFAATKQPVPLSNRETRRSLSFNRWHKDSKMHEIWEHKSIYPLTLCGMPFSPWMRTMAVAKITPPEVEVLWGELSPFALMSEDVRLSTSL